MVQDIWSSFLSIAKEEAGTRVVETWFKAVSLVEWDAATCTVYLQAPNHFVKDWIKANYISFIELHLKRLLNADKVNVILIDDIAMPAAASVKMPEKVSHEQSQPKTVSTTSVVQSVPNKTVLPAQSAIGTFKGSSIGRTYTFETFVVGQNNSLAYAAAQAVAERPGAIYNPLFIYGHSGLGKTHLLNAIGNDVKRRYKKTISLYQTADRFVTEFINAIRFDKVHAFQQKYKSVDVLLIDDIQFISNKEQTQEAFFHIFNTLYDAQKQIVFSSDTYPQNLSGLAERLRYRLACGLVVDMHAPTLETKIAILNRKADLHGVALPEEVADFVASRQVANIRELEGALIRVVAFATLTNQPVTLELAKRVLVHTTTEAARAPIGFERVIKCLNKHYTYTLDDLRSQSRNKNLSMVRQMAMFLMKKVTDKSLRDVGLFLGGRDHSTVMHALAKVEECAKNDATFSERLKQLEQEILSP